MRQKAAAYAPGGGAAWKGGAETFLYKGSNGRWREVLTGVPSVADTGQTLESWETFLRAEREPWLGACRHAVQCFGLPVIRGDPQPLDGRGIAHQLVDLLLQRELRDEIRSALLERRALVPKERQRRGRRAWP